MRQVLISSNALIKELSGDKIVVLSDHKLFSSVGDSSVTTVRFPLEINVLTGGDVNIKFELSKELALAGVILLGAYHEGGVVEAAFIKASTGTTLTFPDTTPVLVGTLIETVRYRQIDSAVIGDLTIVRPSNGAKSLQIKEAKKKGSKKKQ